LFIAPALLPVGPPGRNDANDLRSILHVEDRVGHQYQQDAVHEADGLPAMLAVLDSILRTRSIRIGESACRDLEADAVLAQIALGLGRISHKTSRHIRL
jgi:hypothetical protein